MRKWRVGSGEEHKERTRLTSELPALVVFYAMSSIPSHSAENDSSPQRCGCCPTPDLPYPNISSVGRIPAFRGNGTPRIAGKWGLGELGIWGGVVSAWFHWPRWNPDRHPCSGDGVDIYDERTRSGICCGEDHNSVSGLQRPESSQLNWSKALIAETGLNETRLERKQTPAEQSRSI
ncbi:hypothetical protein VTI28DRAFT_6053 [Corynascus sepedonium]